MSVNMNEFGIWFENSFLQEQEIETTVSKNMKKCRVIYAIPKSAFLDGPKCGAAVYGPKQYEMIKEGSAREVCYTRLLGEDFVLLGESKSGVAVYIPRAQYMVNSKSGTGYIDLTCRKLIDFMSFECYPLGKSSENEGYVSLMFEECNTFSDLLVLNVTLSVLEKDRSRRFSQSFTLNYQEILDDAKNGESRKPVTFGLARYVKRDTLLSSDLFFDERLFVQCEVQCRILQYNFPHQKGSVPFDDAQLQIYSLEKYINDMSTLIKGEKSPKRNIQSLLLTCLRKTLRQKKKNVHQQKEEPYKIEDSIDESGIQLTSFIIESNSPVWETLCIESPYFKKLLITDRMKVISTFHDYERQCFEVMVRCVMSGTNPDELNLLIEEVFQLYAFADFVLMSDFKQKCSDVIKTRITTETAYNTIFIADTYNDVHLKTFAMHYILQNWCKVFESPSCRVLMGRRPDLKKEIFESKLMYHVLQIILDERNIQSIPPFVRTRSKGQDYLIVINPFHSVWVSVCKKSSYFKKLLITDRVKVILFDQNRCRYFELMMKFELKDIILEMKDMDLDEIIRLHEFANDVSMFDFKQQCSNILKSRMIATNASMILVAADMHHDFELKAFALRYMVQQWPRVVQLSSWDIMREEKPYLVKEINECILLHCAIVNVINLEQSAVREKKDAIVFKRWKVPDLGDELNECAPVVEKYRVNGEEKVPFKVVCTSIGEEQHITKAYNKVIIITDTEHVVWRSLRSSSAFFNELLASDRQKLFASDFNLDGIVFPEWYRIFEIVVTCIMSGKYSYAESLNTQEIFSFYKFVSNHSLSEFKQKCSDILKARMTAEIVCDAIAIAHKYVDKDLKMYAINFLFQTWHNVYELNKHSIVHEEILKLRNSERKFVKIVEAFLVKKIPSVCRRKQFLKVVGKKFTKKAHPVWTMICEMSPKFQETLTRVKGSFKEILLMYENEFENLIGRYIQDRLLHPSIQEIFNVHLFADYFTLPRLKGKCQRIIKMQIIAQVTSSLHTMEYKRSDDELRELATRLTSLEHLPSVDESYVWHLLCKGRPDLRRNVTESNYILSQNKKAKEFQDEVHPDLVWNQPEGSSTMADPSREEELCESTHVKHAWTVLGGEPQYFKDLLIEYGITEIPSFDEEENRLWDVLLYCLMGGPDVSMADPADYVLTPELRQRCVNILKTRMAIDNADMASVMTDAESNDTFKSYAIRYAFQQLRELIVSNNLCTLNKERPHLAKERILQLPSRETEKGTWNKKIEDFVQNDDVSQYFQFYQ